MNILGVGVNRQTFIRPNGEVISFSVRKVKEGYSGPALKVRESGNNTEVDIGFTSNGELDVSAISNHCGGNLGLVTKWYDQSGKENDASQSDPDKQPKIYDGTSVLYQDGKPAIDFDSSDDSLSVSVSVLPSYSVFQVLTQSAIVTTGNLFSLIDYGVSGPEQGLQVRSSKYYYRGASSNFGSQDTNQGLITIMNDGTDLTAYKNGSSILAESSPNVSSYPSFTGLLLNNLSGSTRFVGIKVQEVIVYPSDQSSNRLSIEGDISTYFSI